MNPSRHFPLFTLLLTASLLFLLLAEAHADTSSPMFAGSTLTIHGQTFTWTSATEDGSHQDTYTNTAGQTVTVSNPYGGFPIVSGNSGQDTISGHIENGAYGDNHQSFSGDGSWQLDGVTYTHRDMLLDYSLQSDGYGWFLGKSGYDDYSGENGSLHNYYPGSGEVDYDFTGGKVPNCGPTSLTLFGTTYTFWQASKYSHNYSDYYETGWTDEYHSAEDGILKVICKAPYGTSGIHLEVWDPYVGSLMTNAVTIAITSNLSGITWQPRTGPSFSTPQLWADGKILNWQSGTTAMDGRITDTYTCGTLTMTVSALARDFQQGGGATVTFSGTGSGTGTLAHDGSTFAVTGHSIQVAESNRSAPLFTGNATLLKVNNANYVFTGGFQDSAGNRVDVFVNSSLGSLSISGVSTDANHGTVKASRFGTFYNGTFTNGSFSVPGGLSVTKPSSQPSLFGPPAIWVRGELYIQDSQDKSAYQSAAGHSLTLWGGSSNRSITGSDFSGSCGRDPVGVFLVQDSQGASTVPVVWANSDGVPHLAWDAPPTGTPPALMVTDGSIWVFLGTAVEDTSSSTSAAYYGSTTATAQTPRLLKLRTDGSGTVTCTNYSTGASTTGSYSTQSHLFQTSGPQSGFPVPVYGVDPNDNHRPWHLAPPAGSSLPATFIVRGQPWWVSNVASDGTVTYQGYYAGQSLSLGAPDTGGQRIATLVDAVQNGSSTATHGTLSSVRGSIRLRDGTVAFSGTDLGQQATVTVQDNYQMQTIASDLDIIGNNLSFGILSGDASLAGSLFQFVDQAGTATLHNGLARTQAQWLWNRAQSSQGNASVPVMTLHSASGLTLYDPSHPTQAVIKLNPDPAQGSSFKGPLRIAPAGDIDMGEFKNGPTP